MSGTHLALKFGGTSLGDAARIQAAARLVQSQSAAGTPVVVVSAMGSTTDTLVAAGEAAQRQPADAWEAMVDAVEREHLATCSELLPAGPALSALSATVLADLATVRELCRAAAGGRGAPEVSRQAVPALRWHRAPPTAPWWLGAPLTQAPGGSAVARWCSTGGSP